MRRGQRRTAGVSRRLPIEEGDRSWGDYTTRARGANSIFAPTQKSQRTADRRANIAITIPRIIPAVMEKASHHREYLFPRSWLPPCSPCHRPYRLLTTPRIVRLSEDDHHLGYRCIRIFHGSQDSPENDPKRLAHVVSLEQAFENRSDLAQRLAWKRECAGCPITLFLTMAVLLRRPEEPPLLFSRERSAQRDETMAEDG